MNHYDLSTLAYYFRLSVAFPRITVNGESILARTYKVVVFGANGDIVLSGLIDDEGNISEWFGADGQTIDEPTEDEVRALFAIALPVTNANAIADTLSEPYSRARGIWNGRKFFMARTAVVNEDGTITFTSRRGNTRTYGADEDVTYRP